ncbi:MAG TPA: multidrug effflux MFS transporter, partial [Hyphomicrobiales bacterium]|nr:multidrug effflux MFS transporter [Hyphomicrobiales bacterium]
MDASAPSASLRDSLPLPLMAGIAALPPLSIDMYLPAMPQIAQDLGADISVIQNSLSLFLVGFGFGLLVFGPMSDRYGRRPLALFGLSGFALASLGLTLSGSSLAFLSFRLLQGFLGSAATVVIPAMVRDCYGKDAAKGMSAVTMIMLVAPLLAPLLGAFTLMLGPWQGIFAALTVYPVLLGLLAWRRLPETRPIAAVAQRRNIFNNYRIIFGKRSIHLDLVSFMLSSLGFFVYITSVSFIYITYYGVNETLFGILFAFSAGALILANFINVRVVTRLGPRRMLHIGQVLAVCFVLVLGLTTWLHLGLVLTVLGFVGMVGSLGICAVNADALVLIEFPHQASSASAVTGTLRFGFGALAGPLLALGYDGTPMPVVWLLLAVLGLSGAAQVLRAYCYR